MENTDDALKTHEYFWMVCNASLLGSIHLSHSMARETTHDRTGGEINDKDNGATWASAILPTKVMGIVENPELMKIAKRVETKLLRAIKSL